MENFDKLYTDASEKTGLDYSVQLSWCGHFTVTSFKDCGDRLEAVKVYYLPISVVENRIQVNDFKDFLMWQCGLE